MKINHSHTLIGMAVVIMFSGFFITKSRGTINKTAPHRFNHTMPLMKKDEPLKVHNETCARVVNGAFYNKRYRRKSGIIPITKEVTLLKRHSKAPYFAVARNKNSLTYRMKRHTRHTNVCNAQSVIVNTRGHDLVVTPTGNTTNRFKK